MLVEFVVVVNKDVPVLVQDRLPFYHMRGQPLGQVTGEP